MAGMLVNGPSYLPGRWAGMASENQPASEPDTSAEQINETSSPAVDPQSQEKSRLERLEPRIKQLEKMDREVHEHEETHKAIAGPYAGEITYRYITGPDGKRYAIGGSTPIAAPRSRNPQETIRIMNKVRQAALAPGDPSPEDLRMARMAAAAEMKAREQIRQKSDEHREEISEKVLEATGLKDAPAFDIKTGRDGQVKVEYHASAESGESDQESGPEQVGLALGAEKEKADSIGEAYRMAARIYRRQAAISKQSGVIG